MWKIVLLVSAGVALVQGNCGPCPQRPLIYEELNCTAKLRPHDCCPTSFICPDLTQADPSKCLFQGQLYEPGQHLDLTVSDAPCMCTMRDGKAEWTCTHVDCPEYFGSPPLKAPGCKRSYSPFQMCATGQYCPEDVPNMHKCEYRGVTALKGERFVPPTDACYQCTCDENFQDNVFVWSDVNAKNCRKFRCGTETRYTKYIRDNCAPVYYGSDACCPIDWICPDPKHPVEIIPNERSFAELTCKFGQTSVKLREAIETGNKCRTCTCEIPPLLSCVQKANC